MNEESRGSLYLLTGLVIGIALGLIYAWLINPLDYQNTSPRSLASEYKDRQRVLIALAYAADENLERARARLELLEDPDVYTILADQAQRALTDGSPPQEARALGLLSAALRGGAGPVILPTVPTFTPSPSPSPTPEPTLEASPAPPTEAVETPFPASTDAAVETDMPPAATEDAAAVENNPAPTSSLPYILDAREQICDTPLPRPIVEIQVLNAAGEPQPAVEVVITWDGGEEHFYTGLKPELGLGYADFTLQEGETYNLRLVGGAQIITGLTAVQCAELNGEPYWGAWRLTFVQP